MEKFIAFIAQHLVNFPDKVRVDKTDEADDRERYLLFVEPSDRGKIIGRQGRTIKSFRILVGAVAARSGKRASFDIFDDRPPSAKSRYNDSKK